MHNLRQNIGTTYIQDAAHHALGEKDEFHAVLTAVVFNMLQPTTAVLGPTLLVWAVAYLLGNSQMRVPLAIVSALVGSTFLIFALLFKRLNISPTHSNLFAAGIAMFILGNRLFGIAVTGELEQTTSLILLLVGAGFLIMDTPWLIGVALITIGSWIIIALPFVTHSSWNVFAIEMISAVALMSIIHVARRRSFGRQASLRYQSEQRNAELERRALQLEMISTAGHTINAVLDVDVLLKYVVDLIQERFGYYYVGIFMLDETGEYMVSMAGTGVSGQALKEQGFRLKVGTEGLVGWVAKNHEPLYIADISRDARYVNTDLVTDTCSELVLPLSVGDAFLGTLDIQSDTLDAFTAGDIQVFQSLANQVATAIQNATSYQEERSRRLLTETLFEVGQALSQTLDLERVLGLILDHLVQIVGFDRGSVMLQNGDELEIVAALGFPSESNPLQIRVPLKDEDVFGQIHRTKRPLLVDDVLARADWQHVENLPQARAWVGLPFINAEAEVIGMLSLTRETPSPFTRDEVDLAIAFAGHAAFALQNARLYAQLTQAYEQLERMDRTKSDFITIASHELRTPITILKGYSQILSKDPAIKDNPPQWEMVQGILNGALRLHEIVESMIDMAKIDSRAMQLYIEQISFSKLIHKVTSKFKTDLVERNLTLTTDALELLPLFQGDEDALYKVFYHLIINAIKYTPDGGRITISGRSLPLGAYGMTDGGIEMVVSDTGIGIDPDFQDLIFAKFYQTGEVALHSSGRTKFKGGGPGLGLAIVKGMVESHGGQIWVESPGYDEEMCPGTNFHVVLPLAPTCVVDEQGICIT